MFKNKKRGFSLIELVIVIAILAILIAVLAPSLMTYTERSRAQKDVTTMDEVVNAVQLAMADQKCYDEMLRYSCNNNFITYSDSSGNYGQQIIDAEYWAPDGCGRATTITFNPEKASNGDTIYRLENAIVNDMTFGNGSIADKRQMQGAQIDNNQCYLKNASLNGSDNTGYLYNRVRQSIGDSVIATSATYANSSFTIFIRFNQKDGVTVADVNGAFNGTNLDQSSQASLGSGTNSEIVDTSTGNKKPGEPSRPEGGKANANFTTSSLSGNGSFGGNKDYVVNNNATMPTNGVLSAELLGNFVNEKKPKSIIFTTAKATTGTDVSEGKNGAIFAWMDGTTCYVATTNTNEKISGSSGLQFNGNTYEGYQTVEYINVGAIDTSKIKIFDNAFASFGYNGNNVIIDGLNQWEMSQAIQTQGMFAKVGYNANSVKFDVSNFDMSRVKYPTTMFSECAHKSKEVYIGDLSGWNTSNFLTTGGMFSNFGTNANSVNIGNIGNWNVSKVQNMGSMFSYMAMNAKSFNIGKLNSWNVSNVKLFTSMFYAFGLASDSWSIGDLSNWDTSSATSFSGMFSSTAQKSNIFNLGDLGNWNTSNATTFKGMFANCATNATIVNIGNIGKWNTSNVTDLTSMFNNFSHKVPFNCDLSNWDTSNVTSTYRTFHGLSYYSHENMNFGDLGKWDVSNVKTMFNMFGTCGVRASNIYIGDLSSWDTSSCENMAHMFSYFGGMNTNAEAIGDLSNWDTSNVKTMRAMFNEAQFADIGNIGKWNTSNVKDVAHMFNNSKFVGQSSLLLQSWDTNSIIRYDSFSYNAIPTINEPIWVRESIGIGESIDIDIDKNGNHIDNY